MTTAESTNSEYDILKQRIHGKLIGKLDLSKVGDLEGDVFKREIRGVVEMLCDGESNLLNRAERDRLVEEILDETFGLGPLELLLKDPTISDILINGPKNIYCRSSTESFLRSVGVSMKPARWSMLVYKTVLVSTRLFLRWL